MAIGIDLQSVPLAIVDVLSARAINIIVFKIFANWNNFLLIG